MTGVRTWHSAVKAEYPGSAFSVLPGIIRDLPPKLTLKGGASMEPIHMTNQEYGQLVNQMSKESPKARDLVWAFCVGGGICVIGQLLNGL